MTRFSSTAVLALFLFSGFPLGTLFALTQTSSPNRWPNSREKGSYQAKIASTGQVLWQVQWETTVTQEGGRSLVEVNERGEGKPWRVKKPIVWQKKLVFKEGPVLQMQSMVGSRWAEDGHLVSEMDFAVDPALRRIVYKDCEAGRRPQNAVLPWTAQSIPDEMLFHWARTLPFGEAGQGERPSTECMLVVSPNRQVRVKAQVQGTEVVTTPAGTFPCYRVSLTPQLPGPLKALAPRMFLWCRTEPPNYWVRYQGPIGGPGSPEAVIELVKFEPEKTP